MQVAGPQETAAVSCKGPISWATGLGTQGPVLLPNRGRSIVAQGWACGSERPGLVCSAASWQHHFKKLFRDFPSGLVAKMLCSQCRSLGSIPGCGTRSHMLPLRVHMWQRSSCILQLRFSTAKLEKKKKQEITQPSVPQLPHLQNGKSYMLPCRTMGRIK